MPASQTSTSPSLSAAQRASTRTDTGGVQQQLTVDSLSFSYPDRRVLSKISFAASTGQCIGLVGENGTGKSTLLALLAGRLTPETGSLLRPQHVGLLEQELPYPPDTPLVQILDDAQHHALTSLATMESLGDQLAAHPHDPQIADAFAAALDEAERSQAFAAEARRAEMLRGLGLGGIDERRRLGELSGGQIVRLSLACLLLRAPHLLLLDEPSNHLDDASSAYLEQVLSRWPGIVILASHDRALLDAVSTGILDLDPLPVPASELADAAAADGESSAADAIAVDSEETSDTGAGYGARFWGLGYSQARQERREELRRWRERYARELEQRNALHHEIAVGSREVNRKQESKSESKISQKFYADKDARVTARRARNARMRLEALERDRVRRPPQPLEFAGFGEQLRDSAPELRVNSLRIPGRLAEVSFTLEPGARLLLSGPNGAGKSTLLSVLAGVLDAPDETLQIGTDESRHRVGYLPQEVSFEYPRQSAAEYYRSVVGFDRAEATPLALSGLLAERDLHRPVGELSVGQRRRLALATLVADPPELLLLDEPTNHLSLALVEELETALNQYAGTLLIATHDRWLRSRWKGQVLNLVPEV
ncbi:ABC-F family ATP-binding cassette domain-containing protein [Glutamicibacter endophyticus]